jgi:hypothetical protein
VHYTYFFFLKIYRDEDAPTFRRGHIICATITIASLLITLSLRFALKKEKDRRDSLTQLERDKEAQVKEPCDWVSVKRLPIELSFYFSIRMFVISCKTTRKFIMNSDYLTQKTNYIFIKSSDFILLYKFKKERKIR